MNDDELPLVLPELDNYAPSKNGDAPLAKATDWVNVVVDGKYAKRETSTMPGSAGSSWYFLRYIDPKNDKELASKELLKHWMPVDLYIGGPEHAVGHLLYARMWNNYLYDKGIVPCQEPFKKLVHQGMILGANGIKMGKRYPEFVVDPNTVVSEYGADTLRLYEMFMGPLEADKPWDKNGIEGSRRFLERVYRLYTEVVEIVDKNEALEKLFHQTVKKVTDDYENLRFNTAISQMMIFINECYKNPKLPKEYLEDFLKILNPVAPHITEELYHEALGHNDIIATSTWPTFNEELTKDNTATIAIQVNGKLRDKIDVAINTSKEEVEKLALASEKVKNFINGVPIRKVIVVPNKIVNIVI